MCNRWLFSRLYLLLLAGVLPVRSTVLSSNFWPAGGFQARSSRQQVSSSSARATSNQRPGGMRAQAV